MTTRDFDDEILMAFADGRLDTATAGAVAAAIEANPILAARARMFMETRSRARTASAPMLDRSPALTDKVPPGIGRTTAVPEVETPVARVIPFRARTRKTPPPAAKPAATASRRLPPRSAAAIAILAAGAAGYLAGAGFRPEAPVRPAFLDVPGLNEALSSVGSGEEAELAGGARFEAVSSFRAPEERLCREFVFAEGTAAYVAVACRKEADWRIAFAVGTPVVEGGYQPASSLETLESFLTSIDAGPPLSAEEEAAALAGG